GGDDYPEFGAPAQPTSAATTPALMDHLAVGPAGSQAPASSASLAASSARQHHRHPSTDASGSQPAKKNTRGSCRQLKTAKVTRVTNSRINIGYDERHWAAPTAELHSSLAHDIGHVVRSHCPMKWKSWKVMPDEIKTEVRGQLLTNYNLEDLDDESLAYVNRLFSERYKQWKSDLHHYFEAFDDPSRSQEGCPKELEGREDSWAWLCAHFQASAFVNKAKVNKGNRKKKTLLHHSGSRPFSYRMDARRHGGPNSQRSTSLATLKTTMVERSQLVLQESASQLPPDTPIESVDPPQDAGFQILTETLDQTLGRRPGTYCRGMGNARRREPRPRSSAQSNSQVTTLTAQVATLHSQMSVILQSLAHSGIPVPHFDAPTSEPEHPHQTTAPVDPQTSELHVPYDNVDFGTLFD
ncbi:Ankyrin repeat family protein, partial [Prunus dulcis]